MRRFLRDDNRQMFSGYFSEDKELTFTGDGATVATPIFTVTGAVRVLGLWGFVTTAFGVNHTAAHWRINDQTATDQVITAAAGTDLSAISLGAFIVKDGLAAAALTYKTADAASLLEPTTLQTSIFSPFVVVQKTGDIQTDIEYVYTTSDSPTSGAMMFSIGFVPLSPDGDITAS